MKIQYLLYALLIPASVMGMQQDDGDPVKQGLYYFFGIERHYDAMQAYDENLTRYSSDDEIKTSYKELARKLHPDKNKCETKEDSERITENYKNFEAALGVFKSNSTAAAGEARAAKVVNREEYDTFLRFVDIYSIAIKGAAVGITLYSCWLAYQWSKHNLGSSPKATLNVLQASMHTAVDRLLTLRFDRYVHTKDDFSLAKQVALHELNKVISQELSEKLTAAIAKADATASKAFEKIAWDYYDCQTIDDLKTRDAMLVEELLSHQKAIDEIVDECKTELGIESFYVSCARLVKPIVGLSCLIGLGAGWMRYKQSQIKIFGGYLRPEVAIRT
jgi:hypothetical protein